MHVIPATLYRWLALAGLMICLVSPLAGQDSLRLQINTDRIRINQRNMYVLGGWAVGNIAVSGVLRSRTQGSTRYFHEMNVFWNIINLGLSAGGLYGASQEDPASLSAWETIHEQEKLEKILLFNMALNFTYMTAGAYLTERSRTAVNRPERLRGYGQSLIMQGGFLLLFDMTQYLVHHQTNYPRLEQLVSHLHVYGNGIGMNWQF
ncbi:MAG: hypothetical protein SF053_22380 [Bacteroidia bacterium]|nr:hypothetical protein [Bacteroidia bacterium]